MRGIPLPNDETQSSQTTISSMTSYSVSVTESGPTMPFFEAQLLHDSQESSIDKIDLSNRDFTVWQTPIPTVEILDGLRVTPP